MRKWILVPLLLASCMRVSPQIEPTVLAPAHPKKVQREKRIALHLPEDFSKSPFAPLSAMEKGSRWSEELEIALAFAADFDLYRAITGFKRALHFLPEEKLARRLQIDYLIALAYYLGDKPLEVLHQLRTTGLAQADESFAAYQDLLLMVYDSYYETKQFDQAQIVLAMIDKSTQDQLVLLDDVKQGNLLALYEHAEQKEYMRPILSGYEKNAKSVGRAQLFNALVPGAGYWYVGQRQSGVTAFLVNALFAGTAAYFFADGNIPAGVITLSLESGWYFGGIHGAGLAAKQYNESLYQSYADKITGREKSFPSMMLKYSF